MCSFLVSRPYTRLFGCLHIITSARNRLSTLSLLKAMKFPIIPWKWLDAIQGLVETLNNLGGDIPEIKFFIGVQNVVLSTLVSMFVVAGIGVPLCALYLRNEANVTWL
jgi:hypothetical protein